MGTPKAAPQRGKPALAHGSSSLSKLHCTHEEGSTKKTRKKKSRRKKKGEIPSGWFLETAWCPQSASQGMDLCDILISRRSTASSSASPKLFLSAYHEIPHSSSLNDAANNAGFFKWEERDLAHSIKNSKCNTGSAGIT